MRLLLMRHGEAVPGRDSDPDRPLTAEGRKALASPDRDVRTLLATVGELWSSPWLRAQETAALIYPYTCAQPVQSVDELLPSADPGSILQRLEGASAETLLLVGHQPLVGRLGALLCDGSLALPWAFSPADLAVIDLDWPAAGLGYLRRWHRFSD